MGAVFGSQIGFTATQISLFIAVLFAGVLVLQYPIGWLSDQMHRRKRILGNGIACFTTQNVIQASRGLELLLSLINATHFMMQISVRHCRVLMISMIRIVALFGSKASGYLVLLTPLLNDCV